jgi:hypothetical protein
MDQTEHDLRMAFEPGYEEKWQELESYRDRIRGVVFPTREWLPILVGSIACGVVVALLLHMDWMVLAAPAIVMTIRVGVGLAFIRYNVRRRREELGL